MTPADNHDRLADMVNEVFRRMPDNPFAPQGPTVQGALELPEPSPRALEIIMALHRFVTEDRCPSDMLTIEINARQAGEVLALAIGLAYTHQVDEHPHETWVGCQLQTEMVFQAAGLYLQAISNARRP